MYEKANFKKNSFTERQIINFILIFSSCCILCDKKKSNYSCRKDESKINNKTTSSQNLSNLEWRIVFKLPSGEWGWEKSLKFYPTHILKNISSWH